MQTEAACQRPCGYRRGLYPCQRGGKRLFPLSMLKERSRSVQAWFLVPGEGSCEQSWDDVGGQASSEVKERT